jgi:hypothetical protein
VAQTSPHRPGPLAKDEALGQPLFGGDRSRVKQLADISLARNTAWLFRPIVGLDSMAA